MSSPTDGQINFPTQDELRAASQKRFEDIRRQQELDRQAAQGQANQVFGEGSLGRVQEGRAPELQNIIAQRQQQFNQGAMGLDQALAQRQATIQSGGADPMFQQIQEAARRQQDIQTQTSLRQLRGDLGAQGVRGGINVQQQLQTLGQGNLAESQLQAQLAQARLARVSEAQSAAEGLQRSRIDQQAQALGQLEQSTLSARADEQARAETNVQRALQERLGRLQLTESRAQQGTLERAAASEEVTAAAQLQAQLQQQNVANQIALIEAQKEPAKTEIHQSGGGKSVLCAQYWLMGDLTDEELYADFLHTHTSPDITEEVRVAYYWWTTRLLPEISKGSWVYKAMKPFVLGWAKDMAARATKQEVGHRNFLGSMMRGLGVPLHHLGGKVLKFFGYTIEQMNEEVALTGAFQAAETLWIQAGKDAAKEHSAQGTTLIICKQ